MGASKRLFEEVQQCISLSFWYEGYNYSKTPQYTWGPKKIKGFTYTKRKEGGLIEPITKEQFTNIYILTFKQ